jgi:tetratricopeptide (TPR) repeat protein
MKRSSLTLILFASLGLGTAFSQQAPQQDQVQVLTDKAAALFQQGKLDDAIDAASRAVQLEKKSGNSPSYVNAVLNLARMKREKFIELRRRSADRNLSIRDRIDLSKKASEQAGDAERLFNEALELNRSGGRERTPQTADIISELAWLINGHFPADETLSAQNGRSRIDLAESLYNEALKLNEDVRGKDADETLTTVLTLGNFYFRYDNYDKALPFYERYIKAAESKRGSNSPDLVGAMRPVAQILYATFQEPEANDEIRVIEQITGKKEDLPLGKLDLHLRSKESVAFHVKASEMSQTKRQFAIGPPAQRRSVWVPVSVVVDLDGKIIEAAAETPDENLKQRAEKEILKWTVRPFSDNGTPRKLRGYLNYVEPR